MATDKVTAPPEVRQLHKKEAPRKKAVEWEQGLLNLMRKLKPNEQLDVYILAESMALGNIRRRIEQKRLASQRRLSSSAAGA